MQPLPLYRKKIITVSDPAKKELVQGLLARHNIEYRMRAKEILQKNTLSMWIRQTWKPRRAFCEAAVCEGNERRV